MSLDGLQSLPPLAEATLPREVREGSAEDRKMYRAALGFERMLVSQLTERMTDAAQSGSGDDSQPAGLGAYRDMLAGALADAVAAGGGLGLARELYSTLRGDQQPTPGANAGAAAPAADAPAAVAAPPSRREPIR